MKTVTVTKRSRELRELLEIAQGQDLVAQTPGGDAFPVSLIDDFGYEVAQQRQNRKLMAFLRERFRESRKQKGVPLAEVKRPLGLDNGRSAKGKKTRQQSASNTR